MNYIIQNYFILCICAVVIKGSEDEYYEEEGLANDKESDANKIIVSDCWMSLNTPELFKVMDQIDDRYARIRRKVQNSVVECELDKSMIKGFIFDRGIALRQLYSDKKKAWMIPSGINLGGYCMLRMTDSVLFFHRMKLRNNTFFGINILENDLENMVLRLHLSLNDLHLRGAYERCLTDRDPSVFIYAPTFGEVEFLLKNVDFKVEGRYRLIKNRLMIELMTSEINAEDVLMTYVNKFIENAVRVQKENLGGFMGRLKTDLNKWLKDYFNDVMMHTDLSEISHMDELAKYDKEKETALEEYLDNAINTMGVRLRKLNAQTIKVADFTFKAVHGLQIKLYEGVIRGLDSMYRRSVATGVKQQGLRRVDAIIGFSTLKLVYKYEAVIPTGVPPLTGVLTLSADEVAAHLALNLVNNPESIDVDIEFLDNMKPEFLTVEGAANIMISNFRHLLEHQIVSLMSNTLVHGINLIKYLPNCVPFGPGLIPDTKKNKNQQNDTKISQYGEMTDNDQQVLYKNIDENSIEYKAALRSSKKPQTNKIENQSNTAKVERKILKISKRKNKNDIRMI